MAGYPFRPTRSSRGVLNCRRCLDFDQATFVIPGWSEGPDPESRDSGFVLRTPRNDCVYVSTNPVLEPLAAESLCPWGSAR